MFISVFFENLGKGLYTPAGYAGLINYYIKASHSPAAWKAVMGLATSHAAMAAPIQALTEISLGILLVIGLLTRPVHRTGRFECPPAPADSGTRTRRSTDQGRRDPRSDRFRHCGFALLAATGDLSAAHFRWPRDRPKSSPRHAVCFARSFTPTIGSLKLR